MGEPIRTCIGCRRRAVAAELIRLVADGPRLRLGAGRPGRGAWICAGSAPDCFDAATSARQWSRAFRRAIDPASVADIRAELTASRPR